MGGSHEAGAARDHDVADIGSGLKASGALENGGTLPDVEVPEVRAMAIDLGCVTVREIGSYSAGQHTYRLPWRLRLGMSYYPLSRCQGDERAVDEAPVDEDEDWSFPSADRPLRRRRGAVAGASRNRTGGTRRG